MLYNGNYMEDREIDKLGKEQITALVTHITCPLLISEKNIKVFMEYYHTTFSHATVLPKMHLMEDHIIPWLRRWHLGFGMMGEQGAESIHACFNGIERSYVNLKHHPVDRLKFVVKEHHLRISPTNLTKFPPVKRRKKSPTQSTDSQE